MQTLMVTVILAALLLINVAPALQAQDSRPVQSLLEMRRENVVIQNWDRSCGAAALTTILNYQHGDLVTEKEVALSLISRKEYIKDPRIVQVRLGFSLFDLKQYAESRGYKGIGFGKMDLDDLVERAPIIVPVNLFGYNHFVVFRGVLRNRVLLADPAWGNRTMLVDKFENAWIDYGEIGKVGFIVAKEEVPAPPGALRMQPDQVLTLF